MSDLVTIAREYYELVIDTFDAGEDRPGQRAMLEAVATALETSHHLLVEAGTGTGKSLAYLIPAIASGKQTIVATATRALQEQLIAHDLPKASLAIGDHVQWALVKGRSNYLCVAKVNDLGDFLEPELVEIVDWSYETTTGDLVELESPPPSRIRDLITARHDECPGVSKCNFGEQCFVEIARREAALADLLVVNHHLLLINSQLRPLGASFLPGATQVVVDEAHRLEEAANTVFGAEVHAGRFRYLTGLARGLLEDRTTANKIQKLSDDVFQALPDIARAEPLEGQLKRQVTDSFMPLLEHLNKLQNEIEVIPLEGPARDRRDRLAKVLTSLQADLTHILSPNSDEVSWMERSRTGPTLKLTPIEVSSLLATRLLAHATVIFTSATLTSIGGFERSARTLGATECDREHVCLEVESPFDFESNALLYCPPFLPDPRDETFQSAVRAEIEKLVMASNGGAFCLFTSWRAMQEANAELDLPFPTFCQGEAPPVNLVEKFIAAAPAVLLGTQTFWQGVDVPGNALRLVIIDKLPFQPPDDPLVRARSRKIDADGGDSFNEEFLPRAALMLKQGVGRLIRSATDRGVVAILDKRLVSASYGDSILACLPAIPMTANLRDVEAFFEAAAS